MAGEIPLIAKIKPKNDAFVSIVDSVNVGVDSSGFSGALTPAADTLQKALVQIDQAGGLEGASGASGMKGEQGLSGFSGFSGDAPGTSGFSGFSGFSGRSGVPGGTSGYSGFSGASCASSSDLLTTFSREASSNSLIVATPSFLP